MKISLKYLVNKTISRFSCTFSDLAIVILIIDWRVTRGGTGGGGLPFPFWKIGKKCPNLGKNALIVVIYGKDFLFKMQFFRVYRQKNR